LKEWRWDMVNERNAPIEEKCIRKGCIPMKVCFVENKDTGTLHLACCRKIYGTYNTCLCTENLINDKCESEVKNKRVLEFNEVSCLTIEQAREIAAELANDGKKVCARCISMLYHNDT
jgi:hypothetical protein